jgi:hypothetical protein
VQQTLIFPRLSGLDDKAQDEEHDRTSTTHTRDRCELQFWVHFCVDPLNIGVCGDLGLSPPPTPVLEKWAVLGGFGAAHTPFEPAVATFWADFGPFSAGSTFEARYLAAKYRPFWAGRRRPPEFQPLSVGGRQLLSPGWISGSIWMTFFISGTHDRPRDDI